jgi:hypothetical protein
MLGRLCLSLAVAFLTAIGLGPCVVGCQSPTSQVPTMTGRGVQDVKQGAFVTDGRVTISPVIQQSPNEGAGATSTLSPTTQLSR